MSQHENPLGSVGSLFGTMLDPFGVVSGLGESLFGGNKGANSGGSEQGGGFLDALPGVGGLFGGVGNMFGGMVGGLGNMVGGLFGQNDVGNGGAMFDPTGGLAGGLMSAGEGGMGQMLMGVDGGMGDLFSHLLD